VAGALVVGEHQDHQAGLAQHETHQPFGTNGAAWLDELKNVPPIMDFAAPNLTGKS